MADFLRNTDAFTWSMESDPRLRSTIVSLVLLDRTPDWGRLVERFDLLSEDDAHIPETGDAVASPGAAALGA